MDKPDAGSIMLLSACVTYDCTIFWRAGAVLAWMAGREALFLLFLPKSATETIFESLSAYEIERGKPMPNLTHGSIQANLIIQFGIHYEEMFRIAIEVALATVPDGNTRMWYVRVNVIWILKRKRQTNWTAIVNNWDSVTFAKPWRDDW